MDVQHLSVKTHLVPKEIILLREAIDDTIVVLEAIVRQRELGCDRYEAIKKGLREIAGPVVISSATTGSTVRAVTRWVADDQWCVEGGEEKYCASRKIKTMKKACYLPVSQLTNPALSIASGESGKKP